ncbi:MAG: ribose 5-phosphate isomerase B [Tannerella sp.]|jgi:ribose 5-phosphate isomerase B|nr:ribose 5-phosphate isomerase B [Tannerella sp.]
MKKIGLASDHAGFELKEIIKHYIEQQGYTIHDFGTYTSEACDYPDFAHPLANAVESGEMDAGIALCGSGNGIGITLNKHQGIRAAICWNVDIVRVTRGHNNANILVLPARYITRDEALAMVDAFLDTPFDGGRHIRRIEKIPIA